MPSHGPPPKRSDERRRVNVPAAGPVQKVDIAQIGTPWDDEDSLEFLIKQPILIPGTPKVAEEREPDAKVLPGSEDWHPIALEFWESLKRSGQALYWEPSDWMVAKLMCESISRDLKPQVVGIMQPSETAAGEVIRERIPLKGASLGAYLKAFGQLMLTEGERRRLSIELQRTRIEPRPEPGTVTKITDRRQARLAIASKGGT